MWTANDLPIARLVKISAQDHRVHVATEDFQYVEINGRVHVQVGAVTGDRILPVRAVQGDVEIAEERLEILPLRSALRQENRMLLGFHIDQSAVSATGKSAFT